MPHTSQHPDGRLPGTGGSQTEIKQKYCRSDLPSPGVIDLKDVCLVLNYNMSGFLVVRHT